jgi:DNA polymerase-3 subunit gamma/tau
LASHFRDLLVAKDKITIELLEVGDNAKKKYLVQAEKCELSFLMQGIEIANDCDLKYKTSKNQRLLVELALMQIASITFDREKKNNKPYIIAALHFRNTVKKALKKTPAPELKKAEIKKEITSKSIETISKPELKTPTLNTLGRRPSGLSIKSIERKKELENTEVEFEQVDGLPSDKFTEAQAVELWEKYIEKLISEGKKSVASIMNANRPTVKGHEIHFDLPNTLMKDQLQRAKTNLLKYLRETLNNFKIDIIIEVNEEETVKFAYTPEEKYQKLKEKNSALELFKRTFDLDL